MPLVFHGLLGVGFSLSLFGLWTQLPYQGFNLDALITAITDGTSNLLVLCLCSAGIALTVNYLLTQFSKHLGYGKRLGFALLALLLPLVISILVLGIISDSLSGLGIPIVMNTGMSIIFGAFVGLNLAESLPKLRRVHAGIMLFGISVTLAILFIGHPLIPS